MNFKCLVCGATWHSQAREQVGINARGCPRCHLRQLAKRYTLSPKVFDKRLKNRFNGNIVRIGKYVNSNTKIKFKCNRCGYTWFVTPQTEMSRKGNGCIFCHKRDGNHRKMQKQYLISKRTKFVANVIHYSNGKIIPLWKYRNLKTPMKYRCLICGKEWISKSSHFRYAKCSNRWKKISFIKSIERFDKKLKYRYHDKICRLSPYRGRRHETEFKCNKGHIWWEHPEYIISKRCHGCPVCSKSRRLSHLEQATIEYLNSYHITYVYSHRPSWLHGMHLDFYLPKLHSAIEDDGVQHFSPQASMGGMPKYLWRHKNDLRKDKICIDRNIFLIRIKDFHDKSGYKDKARKLVYKKLDDVLLPIIYAYRHKLKL